MGSRRMCERLGKGDREEYLHDLLRQAVCTALEDLDNLLVVRGILRKANFQLPKKLATLLKSLLLLKLPEWKEGRKVSLIQLEQDRSVLSIRIKRNRLGVWGMTGL